MIRSFLGIVFFCSAISLWGQEPTGETHVNEIFRRVPLSKALKTIQTHYGLKIAYDYTLIQNIIVDIVLTDVSVTETFQQLLSKTSLTFQQIGSNIVILPAEQGQYTGIPEKTDLTLSGKIVDTDTDETLPQAVVRIAGTSRAVTSNDDGFFTILHVPADTCLMEISYVGYITQLIRVRDISDPLQFHIRLKNDARILNEVVVLGEYNQVVQIQEDPGSFAFNPRALNSLPTLGEQDISRTMQLMPGITATDESSSGMVIRGMHPSYNLVMLDGMTIYQQDHFFGAFSIINSDIVKDVRVHKGMFDPKYGGRVSGVVDITTKNGNEVKPSYNIRMNGINAKGTAELPLGKKWSLFAGARRSFTDIIQSSQFNNLFDIAAESNDQIQFFRLPEIFGTTGGPRYHFYDANVKLTFRPSRRDILSLSLYNSRDNMKIESNSSFDFDSLMFDIRSYELTRWGNDGLSLRWGCQWNNRYYSNFRISGSKFFRHFNSEHRSVIMDINSLSRLTLENDIRDINFAFDNEWLLNNHLSLEFGTSGVSQRTEIHIHKMDTISVDIPDDEKPEEINADETENSWLTSVYGSLTASIARLTATMGARLNHYHNEKGQLYFEPRATIRYNIHDGLHIKGAYGHSNQFIHQMIYYNTNGTLSGINENFWILSKPRGEYPVISTDHYSVGATLKKNTFLYDAEVYFKKNKGVIIDADLNSGNTTVYGLDVMIQKITGIHKGWIAYSLAHGLQSHPSIRNGKSAPTLQDQRHELKIVDLLTLGNWNLSSTFIFGSGKPYPKFNVKYHRDSEGKIDAYELLPDYSNKSRLPPYYRIDLSASYKIHTMSKVFWEVGLSIHNVTDHKNVKTRSVDETLLDAAIETNTELQPLYQDISLLGFTPSLFVNISF